MATRKAASSTTPASASTPAKRSHSAKPKAETIPGDDAPKAAVQAATGTPYASSTVQSPEGNSVTVANATDKYVVRKRADLPVYEVAPVGYEGPAPLTVPVVDWGEFQKAVAGAK